MVHVCLCNNLFRLMWAINLLVYIPMWLQTSSRKKIAKLLSRGASLASISMECFHDEAAHHNIKRTVGHYIKKELAAMCSDMVNSILLQSSSNDISSFIWEKN